MRKSLLILFSFVFAAVLVGCSADEPEVEKIDVTGQEEVERNEERQVDIEHVAEIEDIKEKVHAYSVGVFENVSASITSHELIVMDEGEETTYELPEDEFFVSIAPFVTYTHECAIHSLTGCQGEMIEKEFDVYIEDEEGKVIVDEKVASFENGFIDLWLPRDKTFEVTISHDDQVVTSEIATFEGDHTCITTMQLT